MSEHERTSTIPAESDADTGAQVVDFPSERTRTRRRRPRLRLWRRRKRKRFRIRKLRVLLLLFGLGVLAAVSAAFGMFMAVASDLPKLEEPAHTPSMLYDKRGVAIGTLTANDRRIYLNENQIAPVMKQAIVAIEDRRFYTNSGVDLRGIARAAVQDVTNKRAVQGASTIPQQFVKITLAAENDRTLFQKLREAALAYQLTRRWSKDRILRNYLNSIYFGNGAYGIESAAKVYFGNNHDKCGERGQPMCASVLQPAEAAMLAGIVASPSAYDPTQHPVAAKRRRDLVLLRMYQQGYLTKPLYDTAIATGCTDELRPHGPAGGHEVPVLHVLDQAAGRRSARWWPAGRAEGVRGRAQGDHDDRLEAAERGPGGGEQHAAEPGRAARLTRCDLQQGRRGASDGRGRRLCDERLQPRHPGPAPAGIVVQAIRARGGAQAGDQPEFDLGVREAHVHPQGRRALHRQQLRGRLRGCRAP